MNKWTVKNAAMGVVGLPVALLAVVIILPFFAIGSVFIWCKRRWLRNRFKKKWGSEGKRILFVYSESPNWQDYIEQNMLPNLLSDVVTLNYSKRSEWQSNKSLEARIWEQWSPAKDFNPMAIILPDRGTVKTVEFYQAFLDFKHGKGNLLREKEDELYSLAARLSQAK